MIHLLNLYPLQGNGAYNSFKPNCTFQQTQHFIHGFRQKRSCETQLIQLVNDLRRQLIQGNQVDLILLDFSKAFDKVNHLKLLFKLSQHGVKGKTLNWIRAFLSGRTQAVLLEGESSSEVPVTSGVTGFCAWASPLPALHQRPTTKYSVTGKVVCRRYRCLPNS